MKRIISVLISFLLIFSLCSCSLSGTKPEPEEVGEPLWDNAQENSPDTTPDKDTGGGDNKGGTDNKSGGTSSGGGSGSSGSSVGSVGGSKGEEKNESNKPQNENPKIEDTKTEIVSDHKALTRDSLYQYSFLTSNEKKLYDKLYAAALGGVNTIDVEALSLSKDSALKVHDAFIADNPQFFYIAKRYSYVISQRKNIVLDFSLYYSDGETEDDFDDDGNPTSTADRTKIRSQIIEFSNKITEFLATVPSNVSELEKEKRIYDFELDTVRYDDEIADAVKAGNEGVITHSFSAYGALCKGLSVCEGYAKLFQYLCYQVGINATQVHGYSDGNHMWNAVKLDGSWYMVDTTWDDSSKHDGLRYYKYFNVTEKQLSADHTTDKGVLSVPNCTATEAAFFKHFALVPNGKEMPDNYKSVIDAAVKSKDKYLCVYRGENEANHEDFINTKIYGKNSPFKAYAAEKGYDVTLGKSYIITSHYYYIQIR